MTTITARLNDLIRKEELRNNRSREKYRERGNLKSRRKYERAVQDLRGEPFGPITKRSHRRYSATLGRSTFPFNKSGTYHNFRPSNRNSKNNKNIRMQAYKNSTLRRNFETVTGIYPTNNHNSLKWIAFKALSPSQRANAVRYHRQPPRRTKLLGNYVKNVNRQRFRNLQSHRSNNVHAINSNNTNIPWGASM